MWRYKFHFTILAEDDIIDEWSLRAILEEAEEGALVLSPPFGMSKEWLDSQQMAEALVEAGSEPGFFGLDDDDIEGEVL